MPRQRKHELGCSLVRLITDAWWRLVFYYRQPKFELFEACALDHQDQTLATQVCTPLEQRGAGCPMCLDRFARVWIRRLSSSVPSPVLKYLDVCIYLVNKVLCVLLERHSDSWNFINGISQMGFHKWDFAKWIHWNEIS